MGSCISKESLGGSQVYVPQSQPLPPTPPPPPVFPTPRSYNLPKGWICQYDPQSKHLYYVNTLTGQRQWDHPYGTLAGAEDASNFSDQLKIYEQNVANYNRMYGYTPMSQPYNRDNYTSGYSQIQNPYSTYGNYENVSGRGGSGMGDMAKGGMMGLVAGGLAGGLVGEAIGEYRADHDGFNGGNGGFGGPPGPPGDFGNNVDINNYNYGDAGIGGGGDFLDQNGGGFDGGFGGGDFLDQNGGGFDDGFGGGDFFDQGGGW